MKLTGRTTIPMKLNHGKLDEELLIKLAETMKKYEIPLIKLTGAKGLVFAGVKESDVEAIRADLELPSLPVVQSQIIIQACAGNKSCTEGVLDTEKLSHQLYQALKDIKLPRKVKVAISGCANCCAQSMVRDLGFIAQPLGWTVTAGGMTGGVKPRLADIIATGLNNQRATDLARKVLETYIRQANNGERLGKTIERIGFDTFKQLL